MAEINRQGITNPVFYSLRCSGRRIIIMLKKHFYSKHKINLKHYIFIYSNELNTSSQFGTHFENDLIRFWHVCKHVRHDCVCVLFDHVGKLSKCLFWLCRATIKAAFVLFDHVGQLLKRLSCLIPWNNSVCRLWSS